MMTTDLLSVFDYCMGGSKLLRKVGQFSMGNYTSGLKMGWLILKDNLIAGEGH